MSVDKPTVKVYATLGALCVLALALATLLARPTAELKPDRSQRAFELDEPPPPPSSSADRGVR
jgi:hypothetical protein